MPKLLASSVALLGLLLAVGCKRTISEAEARRLLNEDARFSGPVNDNSAENPHAVHSVVMCEQSPGKIEFIEQTPDSATAKVFRTHSHFTAEAEKFKSVWGGYPLGCIDTGFTHVSFTHANDGWHIPDAVARRPVEQVASVVQQPAQPSSVYSTLPDAAEVAADIDRNGAREVMRRLSKKDRVGRDEVFDQLITKVGTGDRAWLNIGARLRAVSDAGFLEGLDYGFMMALPNAPDDVLRLVPDREGVCGGRWFLEPPPGVQEDWTRRTERALSAPTADASAAQARAACLAIVRRKPVAAGSQPCLNAVINDPDHYTNVRSGPGSQYPVLAKVVEREVFCVTSQDGKWWKVTTSKGVSGFIHYDRVTLQR
jgi:hypothetical protein